MRIAIPVVDNKLSQHFGHADTFSILDADPENKTITKSTTLIPPEHAPGVLPAWLHEQGVNVILTGGMGPRAQELFEQASIKVVLGVTSGEPEALALAYLNGSLAQGSNTCDH